MTSLDVRFRGLAVGLVGAAALLAGCTAGTPPEPVVATTQGQFRVETFALPDGSGPHDVAPAPDGGVWFTAQRAGYLGHLEPDTGEVTRVPLGEGSAPHGVIVGPDAAAWVTDSGLNAIVRVDGDTRAVRRFPLPAERTGANLNTATFDGSGVLWFTGQSGIYGRLDPATGEVRVYDAPGGRGPYGISTTPSGEVYYASLAGSHIARIDTRTAAATVIQPPTPDQGARRVWSDSAGRVWVSEWNAGRLGRFDPVTGQWREWPLPGDSPQAYAVYVDERDHVWASDFAANTLVRFDPTTQRFASVPIPGGRGDVRQILGRDGEIWGAASAQNRLIRVTAVSSPVPGG